MLEAINKVEQFTQGYREKGFERDALVSSSAVIRQLEVLGEAAANIPIRKSSVLPPKPCPQFLRT
jgi:uncharacterized protein with HEPN domain